MNCADIAELTPLYLAHELPAAQLREFDLHLKQCRSCALELEQQSLIDARLRAVVCSEMPETAHLEQSITGQIGAGHRKFLAAAAAMVLLAAGSVWWVWNRAHVPRLYADAARDHQVEVLEHQPRRWRSGAAEVNALAARFGLSGAAVAALCPAGYKLEHAKICGLDGGPVLHLVYANGAREVSLYVLTNNPRIQPRIGQAVVGKEYLDAFRTNRFTAIVVAAGSRADCLQFAQSASAVL